MSKQKSALLRVINAVVLSAALVAGAIVSWNFQWLIGDDDIAYMDISDAILSGRFGYAVNAHWSPGYPLLISFMRLFWNPGPRLEIESLHVLQVIIYLGVLLSLLFFVSGLKHAREFSGADAFLVPGSMLLPLGVLFLLTGEMDKSLIVPTPDLLVELFVLLSTGFLLKISLDLDKNKGLTIPLFGAVLGFGYVVKAVFFPLSFVFLFCLSWLIARTSSLRRNIAALLAGFAVFAAIAAAVIVPISIKYGHPTFGESGKLNLFWGTNGLQMTNQMTPDFSKMATGAPLHPPRFISKNPVVFEVDGPIEGTAPYWDDPAYWHAGYKPVVSAENQIARVSSNTKVLFDYLKGLLKFPILVLAVFCLVSAVSLIRRKTKTTRNTVFRLWPAVIPAAVMIVLHVLVLVESRYIVAPLSIIAVYILASLPAGSSAWMKRFGAVASAAAVAVLVFTLPRHYFIFGPKPRNEQLEVAEVLKKMGLHEGDKVAVARYNDSPYWVRLVRAKTVGIIPENQTLAFLTLDVQRKKEILDQFHAHGIKVLVAPLNENQIAADHVLQWTRIGETSYYIVVL